MIHDLNGITQGISLPLTDANDIDQMARVVGNARAIGPVRPRAFFAEPSRGPEAGVGSPGRGQSLSLHLKPIPNPFSQGVTIHYELPFDAPVTLSVHDASGRRVAVLSQGARSSGRYFTHWSGEDDSGSTLPAGVYMIRLAAGTEAVTHKVLLTR